MEFIRRSTKITLLIFGLLPYITFILAFTILGPDGKTTNVFFITLGVLSMLAYLGLMVFYIAHVYRNDSIAKDQRILWAALLFFGNIVVYPFYWYLHIWREPKETIEQ